MLGVLKLPYPISANDFWRTTYAKKLGRVIVYQTPEAERWKEAAGWIAKSVGFREPTTKPIALRVIHHHQSVVQAGKRIGQKNGHVFDLDNVLKVAIDGLKKIVYADDRQIKKIVATYGAPTERGGLTIEVEEYDVEPAALFAPRGPAEEIYWKWHTGQIQDLRAALIELDVRLLV